MLEHNLKKLRSDVQLILPAPSIMQMGNASYIVPYEETSPSYIIRETKVISSTRRLQVGACKVVGNTLNFVSPHEVEANRISAQPKNWEMKGANPFHFTMLNARYDYITNIMSYQLFVSNGVYG